MNDLVSETWKKEFRSKIDLLNADIHSEIQGETATGYRHQERSRADSVTKYILYVCILANIPAFFIIPDYFLAWIASSFYMYMAYPLLLIIGPGAPKDLFPSAGTIKEHIHSIGSLGIFRNRETLWTIFLNLFFINCRPLFLGYALIYSVAILFAFFGGFFVHHLDPVIILLVVLQSLAIIIFYAVIWRLRPYSAGIHETIEGLKRRIGRNEHPVWLGFIVLSTLLSALGIIAVTALLLPGFTLSTLLAGGELTEFSDTLGILSIFVLQYFILRFIHGYSSRFLERELSARKVENLEDRLLPALADLSHQAATATTEDITQLEETYTDIMSYYLTSVMYRSENHNLIGSFPVFLVHPDLDLIKDRETLCLLEGVTCTGE